MYLNILDNKQQELFSSLAQFSRDYYLAGGTAIALQIGHRQSIDFDLFTYKKPDHETIRSTYRNRFKIDQILVDEPQELTFITQGVKLTFLQYPFKLEHPIWIKEVISTPNILTLGALKAYTLGRRGKWKDYVDLYFILKKHPLEEIVAKAEFIFKGEFDEKLFRVQLGYFKDIDRSEQVQFMPGYAVADEMIQQKLQEISIS